MCYAPTPDIDSVLHDFLAGVSLPQIARARGIPLTRLLDLLESPEVQQSLHRIEKIERQRAQFLATKLLPSQIADLHQTATSDADPKQRLRAHGILARLTLQLTRAPAKTREKTEVTPTQDTHDTQSSQSAFPPARTPQADPSPAQRPDPIDTFAIPTGAPPPEPLARTPEPGLAPAA
ncbi:MAG: hypothetical protein U0573_15160 [Phycisphaerales bacterium]|nr:hypothetical protein [Planctomycetota bacterium]